MRFDTGQTTVATAGTAVQLSNTADRVLWLEVWAQNDVIFVGRSDVSSTNGRRLFTNSDRFVLDFGKFGGTVLFSDFYVDASANGYIAEWAVVLDS